MHIKIGLEIHAQLNKLRSKLFCSCSTDYQSSDPNTHVCPTCLGLPGALPCINLAAIEMGMKVALALNCQIQPYILFYRKNYFYPDLPKGFQISQYDFPLAREGFLELDGKRIRISRIHLEEDPGRLVYHAPIDQASYTLVDYNRSGIPLVEIVSYPDLESPKQAREFVAKLRTILEYLEVFDGDLEGAMRVDANISLEGGARVEIKNISSHRGLERALSFEISRQRQLMRKGIEIERETRHWDELRGITISLRFKEYEQDYRYFPEPDLPPVIISQEWIHKLRSQLPELPDQKLSRFMHQYKISRYLSSVLVSDPDLARFYEQVVSDQEIDPKMAATWIADVLKGELNYRGLKIDHFSPQWMVRILKLVKSKRISERAGVLVIRHLLDTGGDPDSIISQRGLELSRDENLIQDLIRELIKSNPKPVKDYLSGKTQALHFLLGKLLQASGSKLDPRHALELLRSKLDSLRD